MIKKIVTMLTAFCFLLTCFPLRANAFVDELSDDSSDDIGETTYPTSATRKTGWTPTPTPAPTLDPETKEDSTQKVLRIIKRQKTALATESQAFKEIILIKDGLERSKFLCKSQGAVNAAIKDGVGIIAIMVKDGTFEKVDEVVRDQYEKHRYAIRKVQEAIYDMYIYMHRNQDKLFGSDRTPAASSSQETIKECMAEDIPQPNRDFQVFLAHPTLTFNFQVEYVPRENAPSIVQSQTTKNVYGEAAANNPHQVGSVWIENNQLNEKVLSRDGKSVIIRNTLSTDTGKSLSQKIAEVLGTGYKIGSSEGWKAMHVGHFQGSGSIGISWSSGSGFSAGVGGYSGSLEGFVKGVVQAFNDLTNGWFGKTSERKQREAEGKAYGDALRPIVDDPNALQWLTEHEKHILNIARNRDYNNIYKGHITTFKQIMQRLLTVQKIPEAMTQLARDLGMPDSFGDLLTERVLQDEGFYKRDDFDRISTPIKGLDRTENNPSYIQQTMNIIRDRIVYGRHDLLAKIKQDWDNDYNFYHHMMNKRRPNGNVRGNQREIDRFRRVSQTDHMHPFDPAYSQFEHLRTYNKPIEQYQGEYKNLIVPTVRRAVELLTTQEGLPEYFRIQTSNKILRENNFSNPEEAKAYVQRYYDEGHLHRDWQAKRDAHIEQLVDNLASPDATYMQNWDPEEREWIRQQLRERLANTLDNEELSTLFSNQNNYNAFIQEQVTNPDAIFRKVWYEAIDKRDNTKKS
jgi:hypothetical protein